MIIRAGLAMLKAKNQTNALESEGIFVQNVLEVDYQGNSEEEKKW